MLEMEEERLRMREHVMKNVSKGGGSEQDSSFCMVRFGGVDPGEALCLFLSGGDRRAPKSGALFWVPILPLPELAGVGEPLGSLFA